MATVVTPAPKLVGAEATVINTGAEFFVSMPLSNAGAEMAPNVFVTGITLGAAQRISPQLFPVYLGQLAPGNSSTANVRFRSAGLVPGQRLLLTVRGTYGSRSAQQGFVVNRYVTVPPVTTYPVTLLRARIQATVQPAVWNYTLFNDEPAGSPHYLAALSMTVAAPVTVTGTPAGWVADTDNMTYVGWFTVDAQLPYPNHVAPGASLGGFQIQSPTTLSESTSCVINAWRHDTDAAGLVAADFVATPGRAI
jgi:hypothetical protein